MRIAIVNDSPSAVAAMSRLLDAAPGHDLAWVARDGIEAVERCAQDTPDLILMDLIMPRMGGVEATREIMAKTPCAILIVTATVGGHTWQVYRGSNGANEVFSFIRTSNTNAGTIDVLQVMNWIRTQGWFGDVTIGDVQLGYEITSSAGGLNFTTNSYSVSFS